MLSHMWQYVALMLYSHAFREHVAPSPPIVLGLERLRSYVRELSIVILDKLGYIKYGDKIVIDEEGWIQLQTLFSEIRSSRLRSIEYIDSWISRIEAATPLTAFHQLEAKPHA